MRDKALLGKIKSTIEAVESAETFDEVANLKKLKGVEGYFRIRVGDYRIGLLLQANIIFFVRILHRREFYRYFP